MATELKTIYGQAYIAGNALVQDLISFTETTQTESTVLVIEDIWEDLMSSNGKAKSNGKGYWYWEVEMSDTEDPEKKVKVKVSCPKPGPEVFDYKFEEEGGDSEWSKYWKAKMKSVEEVIYNSTNGLQPKEVTLPGTRYINQNGDMVEVEEKTITRDNLGDIQNLLFNLY